MKLCEEFKDRVIDYFEQAMSQKEKQIFSGHLKDCSSCQREYNKIKKLYDLLDDDKVSVPEHISFDQIKSNIRQQEIRLRRFKVPRFLKILVPVCALAIFVFYILRPEKTVDISIPASVLLEDEMIANLSLAGILNDDLIDDLILIEDNLPIDIDETIVELSDEEKSKFVDILNKELRKIQEDV